jgi:hypothetical protein
MSTIEDSSKDWKLSGGAIASQPAARVFSGRVIFDHLPKTAGQAINTWLRATFGSGCVTGNLTGSHRELIKRFGGEYSILSAHISFFGEGLDSRYQYVTCLRDPIDRVVSWLYFVLKGPSLLPLQRANMATAVEAFVGSEGSLDGANAEASPLRDHISNYYVNHFAAISQMSTANDDEKLARALEAIEGYDILGFYEALPKFLADFAALLGSPPPAMVDRVNITIGRPRLDRISPAFRRSLEELNSLDTRFYRILSERYEADRKRWERPAVSVTRWTPLNLPARRIFTGPAFALLSVELEGGNGHLSGDMVPFALRFSLAAAVEELEIGIHVFDQDGRWAFGTNTTLLEQRLRNMRPGTYLVHYALVAELPEGEYTAGFAFAACDANGRKQELAWYDALLDFHIELQRLKPSVGYASLPVAVDCRPAGDQVVVLVSDASGTLACTGALGDVASGETISLPVTLSNTSSQDWISQYVHPINISYRWRDETGDQVIFEGQRTPLPDGRLAAGGRIALSISVLAPPRPGRYRLQASPVQELSTWFDVIGFVALDMTVNVVSPEAKRHFPATDFRLYSQVGRPEGGARTSTGAEGFLLFGPYAKLPAGSWRAELAVSLDPHGSSLRADVVVDHGRQVLAQQQIMDPTESLSLPFELQEQVEGLEVRLWVTAQADARILALSLAPVASENLDAGQTPPVDANAMPDASAPRGAPDSAKRAKDTVRTSRRKAPNARGPS